MTLLNPVIPVDTFELSYGYFGSGGIETLLYKTQLCKLAYKVRGDPVESGSIAKLEILSIWP